jgi:hypothetical protein
MLALEGDLAILAEHVELYENDPIKLRSLFTVMLQLVNSMINGIELQWVFNLHHQPAEIVYKIIPFHHYTLIR